MSSSAVTTKTSKYTYKSSGGGTADVSIEYSADLSALSRLEVSFQLQTFQHLHSTSHGTPLNLPRRLRNPLGGPLPTES